METPPENQVPGLGRDKSLAAISDTTRNFDYRAFSLRIFSNYFCTIFIVSLRQYLSNRAFSIPIFSCEIKPLSRVRDHLEKDPVRDIPS